MAGAREGACAPDACARTALEHNLSSVALRSLFNLAEILHGGDHYEEALARYEQGLALARKVGNRLFESWLLTDELGGAAAAYGPLA